MSLLARVLTIGNSNSDTNFINDEYERSIADPTIDHIYNYRRERKGEVDDAVSRVIVKRIISFIYEHCFSMLGVTNNRNIQQQQYLGFIGASRKMISTFDMLVNYQHLDRLHNILSKYFRRPLGKSELASLTTELLEMIDEQGNPVDGFNFLFDVALELLADTGGLLLENDHLPLNLEKAMRIFEIFMSDPSLPPTSLQTEVVNES